MLAFAGNSVLCRIALRETDIDAASFTTIRLASGAVVLWLIVRGFRRAQAVVISRQAAVTMRCAQTPTPRRVVLGWRVCGVAVIAALGGIALVILNPPSRRD